MLAGIYYGAKYGGSTTSILLNVPGESASVVTCLDGYQMARKGRAGPALGIAAIASFIAGTVGVVGADAGRAAAREALARLQLAGIFRAHGARPRDGGAARGRLAGEGAARDAGRPVDREHRHRSLHRTSRFTFGRMELLGGIDFVVVAIGVFAIGEVLANMEPREDPRRCCRCRRACATCCRRGRT